MTRQDVSKAFCLAALFAASGCTTNQYETTVPGVFNTQLTLFETVVTNQELLFPEGYDLDNADGEAIGITDCNAFAALDPDNVDERDISYYRLYRADCMGATAYLAGADATVSFLRNLDIVDIVPLLPATVAPQVSQDTGLSATSDLAKRKLTLADIQQDLSLSATSSSSVTAKFDIFEADYETLGLRDLNNDGVEDMILRLNYAVIEGSGRGTEIFFLTRLNADAPIEHLARKSLLSLTAFSD